MFSLTNGVKGISAIVGVLLIMVVAIVGALVIYHSSTRFLSSSLTASSAKGLIIIEAVRVSDGMLVLMVRNIGNAKVIVDRVSIDKDGMTLYMLEVVGDGVAIKPGGSS